MLSVHASVTAILGLLTLAVASPHFGYYYQDQHPATATRNHGWASSDYSDTDAEYQYQSPRITYEYQQQPRQFHYVPPYIHPQPYFYPKPLRPWVQGIPANLKFRVGVISDLDKDASDGDGKLWHSYLKEGVLELKRDPRDLSLANVTVDFDDSIIHTIKSGLAYSGRGMELSTLNRFNGKLYACDDKTGVVYELPLDLDLELGLDQGTRAPRTKMTPIPWAILADGDFTGPNGFKCEWGTIKDGELWIGGHGKHTYNSKGMVASSNDRFIKKISPTGEVTHLDWSENFDKMARALGVRMPGYVIHEAAGWSDVLQKWVFMPRKVSKSKFDPERDLQTGGSIMMIADENFNNIEVVQIGTPEPSEGFSGFKFIPGTGDQYIVALKTTTKETADDLKSFILAFDLNGKLLLDEMEIATQKYEAIEFL